MSVTTGPTPQLPEQRSVRDHIESVVHKLLERIEQSWQPQEIKAIAEAVGSLSCWPNMNPVTSDELRKLAEYEVAKAIARQAK